MKQHVEGQARAERLEETAQRFYLNKLQSKYLRWLQAAARQVRAVKQLTQRHFARTYHRNRALFFTFWQQHAVLQKIIRAKRKQRELESLQFGFQGWRDHHRVFRAAKAFKKKSEERKMAVSVQHWRLFLQMRRRRKWLEANAVKTLHAKHLKTHALTALKAWKQLYSMDVFQERSLLKKAAAHQ